MKCIECGSDTKYKDRSTNGRRCAACKHSFAFEPKNDPLKITDGLFQKIVKDVSEVNSLFFTDRQLYYEFNRRILKRRFWRGSWGSVAGVSGFGGIFLFFPMLSLGAAALLPFTAGACGVMYAVFKNSRAKQREPQYAAMAFSEFQQSYLKWWVGAHGAIEKLLPAVDRAGKPQKPTPPDVTSYSFDRALVTEHAEVAAFLVANNFHFENNCAILSEDGFPFGIRETVMTMLRRNSALKVFALHNASRTGCGLPHRLRGEDWFPDTGVRVVDLGLRPSHAQKSRMILLRVSDASLSTEQKQGLTHDEVSWLEAGHVAELETLRPARLMRAVYQGFARANQIQDQAQNGGIGDSGGGIWIYDGGVDVYATDSFG